MVGVETLPISPHGKAFYCWTALFTLLFGCVFVFGVFSEIGGGVGMRLLGAGIAIIFLGTALQSIERIFHPLDAQRRSGAVSDSARHKLRLAWTIISKASAGGFCTGAVMQMIRVLVDGHRWDLATDIQQLSAVLMVLAFSLADICGEKAFPRGLFS